MIDALEQAGVPRSRQLECLKWALGDDFDWSLLISDAPERWNKLHSDKFIIHLSDNFLETTKNIGRAWLEEQNKVNHVQ